MLKSLNGGAFLVPANGSMPAATFAS